MYNPQNLNINLHEWSSQIQNHSTNLRRFCIDYICIPFIFPIQISEGKSAAVHNILSVKYMQCSIRGFQPFFPYLHNY